MKKIKNFIFDPFFIGLIGFAVMIIIIIVISTIDNKNRKSKQVSTIKLTITKVGKEDGPTHGKFHTPMEYKTWLLRSSTDTTMFYEMHEISAPAYYNHKVGDTITLNNFDTTQLFKIY